LECRFPVEFHLPVHAIPPQDHEPAVGGEENRAAGGCGIPELLGHQAQGEVQHAAAGGFPEGQFCNLFQAIQGFWCSGNRLIGISRRAGDVLSIGLSRGVVLKRRDAAAKSRHGDGPGRLGVPDLEFARVIEGADGLAIGSHAQVGDVFDVAAEGADQLAGKGIADGNGIAFHVENSIAAYDILSHREIVFEAGDGLARGSVKGKSMPGANNIE